jgi:hypothetical protein
VMHKKSGVKDAFKNQAEREGRNSDFSEIGL